MSEVANAAKKTARRFLTGKHWWILIFCLVCWYLSTGTSADGLNVTVPGFCEMFGWNYSLLLTFNTIAGLVAMGLSFVCGAIIKKYGVKCILVASGIIAGAGYVLQGLIATTVPMYFITLMLGAGLVNTFSAQCTGPLVASWMPRTRGFAMGIITAGSPICTATYLWFINFCINHFGFRSSVLIPGLICIIWALIGLFTVKSTPEEAGTTADNQGTYEDEEAKALESYVSPWTVKKLLTNREVWLIIVAFGLMMMANTGVISQMIPRLTIDKGIGTTLANTMFSVAAVCGIVLSICWGWLDQKIGTKRASIVMCLWFILSVVFNLIPNNMVTTWISIIMIGGNLGGTANFMTSMVTRKFGRKDFNSAYAVIFPVYNAIRTFAFAYTGIMTAVVVNLFGQMYAGAYFGLIVLIAISLICICFINYDKFLGHDEELAEAFSQG